MLKAMADATRYSIYRQLAVADGSIGANDLADRLGLHANTVRLHLERMRDAGLVEVEAVRRGTVGRPQHVYALAAGATRGGSLDQPVQVVLSGLLASLAETAGADAALAVATGRSWGAEAGRQARSHSCVDALTEELDRLGFEHDLRSENDGASIAFLSCAFRESADAYPEIVCNLHRGICEGVVEEVGGGTVNEFTTWSEHQPCRVTVGVGATVGD